jgi:hypothetical protein
VWLNGQTVALLCVAVARAAPALMPFDNVLVFRAAQMMSARNLSGVVQSRSCASQEDKGSYTSVLESQKIFVKKVLHSL